MDYKTSYEVHRNTFRDDLVDEERKKISKTWFDQTTADYWRHERGYRLLEAFSRDVTILTIGDGRFGLDSVRIRNKGFKYVIPSDISENLLEESKRKGYISEYRVINAENISMEAESFDYLFCKESFHHFPRPFLALYEMLRVAKKGVMLTEPNDNGKGVSFCWEEVGNYVYRMSLSEIVKVALAMNLPAVCYWGFNDSYIKGCEFEPADESKSEMFHQMLENIRYMDENVRLGKCSYNKVSVMIFKELPSKKEIEKLKEMGCSYIELPSNPYLDDFGINCNRLYVYGTGNGGERVTNYFKKKGIDILGYVDSDESKWGKEYYGKRIISPDELMQSWTAEDRVVIATLYYKEIKARLLTLGVHQDNILISPFTLENLVL